MLIPQEVYRWLVRSQIIPNQGEIDDRGLVCLPPTLANNFDNGYLIGEIIRKICLQGDKKVPSALGTVKSDNNKNTRLTNWNFIWLAIDAVGLKLDTRIKELILQGEQALVVQVLRQLYERDPNKQDTSAIVIKPKASGKSGSGNAQVVDVKKINLSKDPEESESSLQFLILLLKTSLGMNLEEILGLFTNHNKYLAHIIVKGINDNFDPVILFYSLLNKYAHKLKQFYQQDSNDAQACLYALKPGFISKNQKVAELTIELFNQLGNIYSWLTSDDSKNLGTMLLGLKRHPELRELQWIMLLELIEGEEIGFFTKYYPASFQTQIELVQITSYLVKYISESQSFLAEKLTDIGVTASWLDVALGLPEDNLEAQIVSFKFIGELMFYLPEVIEQNQESLVILSRNWQNRSMPQFTILFNELITILENLGSIQSSMAGKVYLMIAEIAKVVGAGDKRDYLVQNFLPLIAKFPTIPSQYLILNLKRTPLSGSEFLLVCESIEINQNIQTLIKIGNFLKNLFLQNTLVNFYLLTLLKQITQKILKDQEEGMQFLSSLLTDSLQLYSNLLIKYKPKPKQQESLYFGRKGNPQKANRQDQDEAAIKNKQKQLLLQLIISLTNFAFLDGNQKLKELIKEKLLSANSNIKVNNHKIGSRQLEDLLSRRFAISKQEQSQHVQQLNKKVSSNLDQSTVRRSKAVPNTAIIALQLKQQEERKKAYQLELRLIQQKKKQNARKQLEITNLLRGQIGEAQLREEGFLERLMVQPKELPLVYMDQLESREVQAIDTILKKHHKVLRYLFLTYTGTMYSNHTFQKFEDNQNRKQILTAVELGKMLKQYKFAFLTNQQQLINIVRDINIKILGRRQVNELDYAGFQQFVIQYCALIYTRSHTVTKITKEESLRRNLNDLLSYTIKKQGSAQRNLKDQPVYIILKYFFSDLKREFVNRKQKVSLFQDINDIPLSKEQTQEIQIFNKKLLHNPNYILPKDYKKIVQTSLELQHKLNSKSLPQQYEAAIEALDYIFSQPPLNMHIIEDIAQKITIFKVKPNLLGSPQAEFPKQRAMSTLIQRKAPILMDMIRKKTASKGIITALKELSPKQKGIGVEAAVVLQEIVDKISSSQEKEAARQKKMLSIAKFNQIQKAKNQHHAKRIKQKEQAKQLLLKKEREDQRKRRQRNQKFLQQQRLKLEEKRKKDEQQRQLKLQQEQYKQLQKKQNKQKFKVFHQGQLQKIKKIFEEVTDKIKKSKDEEEQERYRQDDLKKKLRQKIEQDDKKILEPKKQVQAKIIKLYQSQPIKNVLQNYRPNLKAVFDFLLQHTYLSLTQKKHNNEVIYDTWRNFLNSFELSPLIMQAKDVVYIFKIMTRDKLTPKQYHVGLSFQEFQEALFRISIKYNTFFNLIADKIKDNIDQPPKNQIGDSDKKAKKGSNKVAKNSGEAKQEKISGQTKQKKNSGQSKQHKSKPEGTKMLKKQKPSQKQQNEFDEMNELNIKNLIKENNSGKEFINEYGDITKVTEKTLLGLIYYLKVPSDKIGQEKRFREVLSQKTAVVNSEKLKQKLSEDYSLQNSNKKGESKNQKGRSGSVSVQSIK